MVELYTYVYILPQKYEPLKPFARITSYAPSYSSTAIRICFGLKVPYRPCHVSNQAINNPFVGSDHRTNVRRRLAAMARAEAGFRLARDRHTGKVSGERSGDRVALRNRWRLRRTRRRGWTRLCNRPATRDRHEESG